LQFVDQRSKIVKMSSDSFLLKYNHHRQQSSTPVIYKPGQPSVGKL